MHTSGSLDLPTGIKTDPETIPPQMGLCGGLVSSHGFVEFMKFEMKSACFDARILKIGFA